MPVRTGDKAPEFDLEVKHGERVRLSDFLGRSNVLLVFHPFAFTAVCEEEARDLQENLGAFRNAQTEIVLVSCDPSPARQAWR
jgi:peroxiredoxin